MEKQRFWLDTEFIEDFDLTCAIAYHGMNKLMDKANQDPKIEYFRHRLIERGIIDDGNA